MDYINHFEFYMSRETLDKIRKCGDIYLKSAVLVRILFRNKKDKIGKPYIGHLLRVSDKMTTLDGMVLGLLHDVVEDIPDVEFDDLLDIGIPDNIVDALKLVTKKPIFKVLTPDEKLCLYNEEIDKILASGNDLALELKISDISDNYNPERLSKNPIDKQEWFRKKYEKQLIKLKSEKERRNINVRY